MRTHCLGASSHELKVLLVRVVHGVGFCFAETTHLLLVIGYGTYGSCRSLPAVVILCLSSLFFFYKHSCVWSASVLPDEWLSVLFSIYHNCFSTFALVLSWMPCKVVISIVESQQIGILNQGAALLFKGWTLFLFAPHTDRCFLLLVPVWAQISLENTKGNKRKVIAVVR